MDTRAVLDHHLAAFRAGDIDETMKDYTDGSVMLTLDGEMRGLDALRATFSDFFAGEFAPGSYEFALDKADVEGDIAYVVWHASSAVTDYPIGSDTFLIRGGKILVQTVALFSRPL